MALAPLQELIAETALALPEARTLALAGGGAMIAHGYTDRATRDIDLFTEIDDDEAVHVVRALRDALQDRGIVFRDAAEPRAHRFVAVDPHSRAECLVEVFADGGRLQPLVTLGIGAVLHPEDLAADKVLALWARARPRDYHDVATLIDRFGRDRLLELAAEKDAGFTPQTFVDALTAIRRLSDADWAEDGIEPASAAALKPVFEQWNSDLRNAPS